MGLMDDLSETEEEQPDDDEDSGTYIQFISGPNHRDFKESWSDQAKADISKAYHNVAPEANGIVNRFAKGGHWDDRAHFYAVLTNSLADIFEENDFQPMLDFLLGTTEDTSDETIEMYADALRQYLSDNPEVQRELLGDESEGEAAAEADDD